MLNRPPFTYWAGVGALVSAFYYAFLRKNYSRSRIVALVIASVIYVELPRLIVAHAIFSAIFIEVAGLQVELAVSHILPILLRLALAITMLSMATHLVIS